MREHSIPPGVSAGGSLARLGRLVRRVEESVVLTCVVIVVASVIWGVLTRYVSQRPAAWTGEVASIAFCWIGFVGATLIYSTNGHPRIFDPHAIASAASRRAFVWLGGAVQVAVLVAVGLLALKQFGINLSNPTAVLRLPGAIYYLPIIWFSAASLVRILQRG
jgi:TRAP-type C4-dicarboxylate transport system permease small subunit